MSRTRSDKMQSAIDRVTAGERCAHVARDLSLQATAIHAAIRTESRRASIERHRQEVIRDAKRYAARRKRYGDEAAYDAASDLLLAEG